MQTKNFIFEIGVEEIPARFIPIFEKEIEIYFIEECKKLLLSYTKHIIIATPRRIGILIYGLEVLQGVQEEILLGPPVNIARSTTGEKTPALEAFLKKTGLTEENLFIEKTEKGEYLSAKMQIGGKNTAELLTALCEKAILHLSAIQKMKWGTGKEVFARPICSLLALYGEEQIQCSYGKCTTQNPQITFGHRILSPNPIEIYSADEYLTTIETVGKVLPLTAQRKKSIEVAIENIEKELNATLVYNTELLDENVNLCEYPYVLLGDIEQRYLTLPREIFLTSIETHQRSFGIEDTNGVLLPHFITILNNNPENSPYIKSGWERVLRARLEDAIFFFENDSKQTFKIWLDALEDVTFIYNLGTMKERSLRLQALALHIAHILAPEQANDISRAGRLCKTDLVSDVVNEFDTLQGIMGGIYAEQKGENEIVSQAITEHYLPTGIHSATPKSIGGICLALADKIDLLVGCFGMKMIPTGTTDTQALRRMCLGVIRIILDNSLILNFEEIFTTAHTLYGSRTWKQKPADTHAALEDFFVTRIRNYFISLGYETLCIDAVLTIEDTLPSLYLRLQALKQFMKLPDATDTFLVFKRIYNIIEKNSNQQTLTGEYDEAILLEDAEKELHKTIIAILPTILLHIKSQQYEQALQQVSKFCMPLNTFFDSVLVLSEDPIIKNNRLRMLNKILEVLQKIININELQI